MNMWAVLMVVLFAAAFTGLIYLVTRMRRFAFYEKIFKEKSD